MQEAYCSITGSNFNFEYCRRNLCIDLTNVLCNRNFEKTLIYLNTVTNYSIWRHRNDIRYKFESFNLKTIAKKMIRSIGTRRLVDPKMTESFRVPVINQLYDALVGAVNRYPFDNG